MDYALPHFELDSNKCSEVFHSAYFQCVTTLAGMALCKQEPDCGLDYVANPIIWNKRQHQYSPSNITLNFQLKSTTQWNLKNGKICYFLNGKNYNDLVIRNLAPVWSPLILVLMCLPKSHPAVNQNSMGLTLMRCCYWYILEKNVTQEVSKTTKIKIKIPVENFFSSEALARLANRAWNGWGGVIEE